MLSEVQASSVLFRQRPLLRVCGRDYAVLEYGVARLGCLTFCRISLLLCEGSCHPINSYYFHVRVSRLSYSSGEYAHKQLVHSNVVWVRSLIVL